MGHPHIKHFMNMTFDLCPTFCFVHVHVSLNKPVRLLMRKYEHLDSKFYTMFIGMFEFGSFLICGALQGSDDHETQ